MRGGEGKTTNMRQVLLITLLFVATVVTAQSEYPDQRDSIDSTKPSYYLTCLEMGYNLDGLGASLRYRFCNNTNKDIVNYGITIYTYDAWDKPVRLYYNETNKSTVTSPDCLVRARSCSYYPCNREVMFYFNNRVSKIKVVLTKIKYSDGKVITLPANKKYVYWVNAGNHQIECDEN
jgi:hypothetical protein